MACQEVVYPWAQTFRAQAAPALWSLGMVLARSRALAAAVASLWLLLVGGEAENAIRGPSPLPSAGDANVPSTSPL